MNIWQIENKPIKRHNPAKELRIALGMTRKRLAGLTGYSTKQIAYLEKSPKPNMYTIADLLETLGYELVLRKKQSNV